jgi:hypothetical protein
MVGLRAGWVLKKKKTFYFSWLEKTVPEIRHSATVGPSLPQASRNVKPPA